jgi:hypothetical protein
MWRRIVGVERQESGTLPRPRGALLWGSKLGERTLAIFRDCALGRRCALEEKAAMARRVADGLGENKTAQPFRDQAVADDANAGLIRDMIFFADGILETEEDSESGKAA